jgi:spore coat polysaccharide biosynthesis predicted glycosyltransferase SpsG
MKIIIICIGNVNQGTGHVYRMLRLTNNCFSSMNILNMDHEILFIVNSEEYLAIKILKKNNIRFIKYSDNNDLYSILSKNKSDIIINDCLNTSKHLIVNQKKYTQKVINFEDYGSGVNEADLIINSFYNKGVICGNKVYTGLKYTLLSPLLSESKVIKSRKKPHKIILTFGGSDPNNIVLTVLKILIRNNIEKKIHILVILGIGYAHKKDILELFEKHNNISISIDEQNMISQFQSSDIAITSCGCAMFEACYFLLPTICISHNDREILHTDLCPKNTIINMGLFSNLDELTLITHLNSLIESEDKRNNIRKNMLTIHNEMKDSYKNVFDLIFRE